VFEQTLGKGKWGKERPVPLKRLYNQKKEILSLEDQKVVNTLRYDRYGWNPSFSWDKDQTLLALVGHSCVYHASKPEVRLDLVAGSPELIVKQTNKGSFLISLSHSSSGHSVFVEEETPSRYRIIEFPKSMIPLVDVLGKKGLQVPEKAKDHILSILQKASPLLPIHSDLEDRDIPAREGDATPCIQIIPLEEGLKMSLLVRPFGEEGPYFRPGYGRESLILFLKSQNQKANRSIR
jgi:hypothetical protein